MRQAQPSSGHGRGNGVRDVYAVTYEEASQQVLDEYYLRNGDRAPTGRAQGNTARERQGEAGRPAGSAREQVSTHAYGEALPLQRPTHQIRMTPTCNADTELLPTLAAQPRGCSACICTAS